MTPARLTRTPSMVVISDRIDWHPDAPTPDPAPPWQQATGALPVVEGSYLERLPLACIAAGIVDRAEIWHHRIGDSGQSFAPANPHLGYRGFPLRDPVAPFDNRAMLDFVATHGAPHILVIYGLGVAPALLEACGASIIVYNSIDAPALRVSAEVSRHVDLVLTGAQWQSDEVAARHPGMATAILPVGPEFAGFDQFRPLDGRKDYDLIYVAAAQGYKQHDLLLDALETLPRDVRGLFVFGYGEEAARLRARIADAGLSVDCIGPPGVGIAEVNRLMNRARFGMVCGRDDGAPAILTEYMLAGLPVLCNAELVCGRQYILPETGRFFAPDDLAAAIMAMRADPPKSFPRETSCARWTWPHTIARFRPLLVQAAAGKNPCFDLG